MQPSLSFDSHIFIVPFGIKVTRKLIVSLRIWFCSITGFQKVSETVQLHWFAGWETSGAVKSWKRSTPSCGGWSESGHIDCSIIQPRLRGIISFRKADSSYQFLLSVSRPCRRSMNKKRLLSRRLMWPGWRRKLPHSIVNLVGSKIYVVFHLMLPTRTNTHLALNLDRKTFFFTCHLVINQYFDFSFMTLLVQLNKTAVKY